MEKDRYTLLKIGLDVNFMTCEECVGKKTDFPKFLKDPYHKGIQLKLMGDTSI